MVIVIMMMVMIVIMVVMITIVIVMINKMIGIMTMIILQQKDDETGSTRLMTHHTAAPEPLSASCLSPTRVHSASSSPRSPHRRYRTHRRTILCKWRDDDDDNDDNNDGDNNDDDNDDKDDDTQRDKDDEYVVHV